MGIKVRTMVSQHYKDKRSSRENFIKEYLGGDGYIVDGFVVDRHHKDGLEVHSLTDKGVIIIHNLVSGKLISKLIARPQQLRRYYQSTGREPPPEYEDMLKLALEHQRLGYNNM